MDILHFSVLILFLAFFCEYIDSSLGMGYGTTLTPLLLIMGYNPLQIVPAILLSELFSGLSAAFFHHKFKNVNFKIGGPDFKIAIVMAGCSVFGALAAVFIALKLTTFLIKLYIGLLVFSMGVLILFTQNRIFKFSWRKITSLGLLAAFNKGISGGGYGPLVTSGQILSGVESKNAIGITSLSEGVTCFAGVITYLIYTNHTIDWRLAPSLAVGAILSVPIATYTVKRFKAERLRLVVGVATLILGLLTLGKLFL
ncbi:MAG: sulfite exporter TauE/SafE family protein [Candidatus Aminicenantes bacterium]|nr:MAG: sulfite exporter TauE/SafE family protein [Candidatus Aminicenantes bacterium]